MVEEQCQQHLLLEPSDIGATVCPWENHTALLSEEINGKEPGEVPKKNVIQPNPIDLDTTATAQDTKYPLPVAPSVDQVYILPSPAPQPTPATKSKPAAPAPKAKHCQQHPLTQSSYCQCLQHNQNLKHPPSRLPHHCLCCKTLED